ncbi:Uncharacterised protein [Enterobacter hormaechei]|uniref:hypothetical protein n=1 Tax=Enterobacter hormaechei TaxID=158836 RepID=UPI001253276D|nr:hypothetical protein [Enterobacter hormaechei]VAE21509.1 Uncharacterised protein [Enterobacter hormaechei]VAE27096.1 Uncharacterised protein [Enterobacter hormaechei]
MGVRQDGDGNYVTDSKPWVSHDTASKAYTADAKDKQYKDIANTALNSPSKPSDFEGSLTLYRFFAFVILFCAFWAVIFCLILIPGANSASLLAYQDGVLAIPGQIFLFIFKIAYWIFLLPMRIASTVNPYDTGTHIMWQAIMMAVTSGIVYKFRRKVTKPILYLLSFLAVIAYLSVGIVAINDNLWSAFKMFPYL